jgi:hypothetical protein
MTGNSGLLNIWNSMKFPTESDARAKNARLPFGKGTD